MIGVHPRNSQLGFNAENHITILISVNTWSRQELHLNGPFHIKFKGRGKGCQDVGIAIAYLREPLDVGRVEASE